MDASLKSKLKKALMAMGILFAIVAVLVGFYIYAGNYLPGSLQAAYQKKDCATVLNNHSILSQLYPFRSVQENISVPALECALYTNAQKLEENGKWLDAYQTYKTCAETYPDGLLASDANQQAGISLLSQAAQQQEQRAYAESVETLKRVMAEYPSQAEATERYAEAHLSWGSEYQSRGEFQAAEGVLLSLQEWGQAGEYEMHVENSQSALASLYLAWGESHQAAGELIPAMAKYRQAIEIAPDSEFASRATGKQVEILLAQGDAYMEAGNYQSAIDAYQRGVSGVNADGQDRLHTATAQAYLAWAKHNVERGDYYQALEKVESAGGLPLPETVSGEVDSYKQEIYTAFAGSSGDQATRLIQDAVRALCKNEKKTFPPVIGIDPDASGFILYGIDKPLPDEWVAKTPGQLKYVVCAELATEVVQEIKARIVWYGRPETAYIHSFTRTQYMWKINVMDVISRDIYATNLIKGSVPPPLDERQIKSRTIVGSLVLGWPGRPVQPLPPSTEGGQPDINDLIRWLKETVVK